MGRLPLEGIRIIDLTMVLAGPFATRLLADLGADVIKIEGPTRWDVWRGAASVSLGSRLYPNGEPGERPYNRNAYFNTQNRNKRAISLDLASKEGRNIFLRLVEHGDVVIENYSPRVMENLDLSYPVLHERNPKLVMVSMPAFGLTGPERDYVCYGTTIETASGHSSLLGYPDGPPMHSSMAFGDPIAGLNGALAVLLAVTHAKRTGVGQHVDLSQLEATIPLIGEYVLDAAVNQRDGMRRGNGHSSIAPHGCYRCAGEDEWVTIAAGTDLAFSELARAMNRPELTTDDRFRTPLRRWKNATELNNIISEWTRARTSAQVFAELRETSVAVGPVRAADALLGCEQLNARGFFEEVEHPEAGKFPYPGMPWRLSHTPVSIRMPAPCFAEHNREVFQGLLGLSEEQLEELHSSRVTSSQPIEVTG